MIRLDIFIIFIYLYYFFQQGILVFSLTDFGLSKTVSSFESIFGNPSVNLLSISSVSLGNVLSSRGYLDKASAITLSFTAILNLDNLTYLGGVSNFISHFNPSWSVSKTKRAPAIKTRNWSQAHKIANASFSRMCHFSHRAVWYDSHIELLKFDCCIFV